MKILAIDSSAKSASVAVCNDKELISEAFVNIGLTHSETLMPMIQSVLFNAKLNLDDIDVFAVTVGPGSFTGVRIGTAVVKGLAQTSGKPCAAVSTLEAMAEAFSDREGVICAAMDARCGQVYTALFESDGKNIKRLTGDIAISLEELYNNLKEFDKKVIFVGDGAELCFSKFGDKLSDSVLANGFTRYQRAHGAALAAVRNGESSFVSSFELAPVYIRPPQAERELKLKKESNK